MLVETVIEAARRFGDAIALVEPDGTRWSFADLDRVSDTVAAGLARMGTSPGDVVGLALPASAAYVVAYIGAAKVGAATAGVNPRLAPPERDGLLDLCGARVCVATTALAPSSTPAATFGEVDAAGLGAVAPHVRPDPDRPVAVVFTSGTTGQPKGAVFTGRQLAAVTAVDVGDQWGGGGRMMANTSLAHIGFMTKLPWYLRLATTTFLLERWQPAAALELVSEARLTGLGAVPTQLGLMLREADFDRYDLSSVSTITVGAAAATVQLLREAQRRFGAPISVRYSSTETGGCGTGTPYEHEFRDDMGVGWPRGPIEVFVRDADGQPLPTGEVGEVCVRSPTAMAGYLGDREATATAFTPDGAVRTGDLGRLDESGELHLVGRSKEMYVRGGYNVYPAEVEQVLAEHPAVAGVAVVSVPDELMGERGYAFVVPRPGAPAPSLDGLRRFAAAHLGSHKLPDGLVVVDAIPLTPMDKVDKAALRARLPAGQPHSGTAFAGGEQT